MSSPPIFFLPLLSADEYEQEYATMAKKCGRSVPEANERIYSIGYDHDGEHWTASVGEQLKGMKWKTTGPRFHQSENKVHLTDEAVVLAIFPGAPYIVVTDGALISGGRTKWANPFYAGEPTSITLFSV